MGLCNWLVTLSKFLNHTDWAVLLPSCSWEMGGTPSQIKFEKKDNELRRSKHYSHRCTGCCSFPSSACGIESIHPMWEMISRESKSGIKGEEKKKNPRKQKWHVFVKDHVCLPWCLPTKARFFCCSLWYFWHYIPSGSKLLRIQSLNWRLPWSQVP